MGSTLLMHLGMLPRLTVLQWHGVSKAVQLDTSLDEDLRVAKVDEGVTCKGFYITQ
jgi:hypothetical protein